MRSVAINFVTTEDVKMLREIEQFYNTEISEMVSFAREHLGLFGSGTNLLAPLSYTAPQRR